MGAAAAALSRQQQQQRGTKATVARTNGMELLRHLVEARSTWGLVLYDGLWLDGMGSRACVVDELYI